LKPPFSRLVLSIIILFFAYENYAQQISVQTEAKPLGELLTSFHKDYNIQVSFNARLLNKCLITTDQKFASPYKAFDYLAETCGCTYKVMDGVFVIIKKRVSKPKHFDVQRFIYQGKVVDKENQEKLPYATILIDKTSIMTDSDGNFTYQSEEKEASLLASHVGYFVLDTSINADRQLRIELSPSITDLQEVIVVSTEKIKILNPEQKSGLAKINNRQTPFLPGNNNNSLFSFLRLQPGIMASGEQNNGYILWGGEKGESHILFDGITIFNTSNYNDKIGAINPMFIKDIEVLKGGYNVEIGDRLGGVVNITSKSGNIDTATYELAGTLNSFNGYVNLGIAPASSVQVGARIVWPTAISSLEGTLPSALFVDVTTKYTHRLDDGSSFAFTTLTNIDASRNPKKIRRANAYETEARTSILLGGSGTYIKPWEKIGRTNVRVAYSEFSTDYSIYSVSTSLDSNSNPQRDRTYNQRFFNNVQEISIKGDHYLPALQYHQLSIGANITHNNSRINHGIIKRFSNVEEYGNRFGGYLKDELSLFKWLVFRLGIRIDLPLHAKTKILIQPRIEAILSPSSAWKINIAHGVYNQFITETTIVDVHRNYTYHWSLTDRQYHTVPQATHTVLGISGRYRYWNCRVESYYKRTKNTLQYWSDSNDQIIETSSGKSYNYGLDVKLGAHYKNQQIWMAYTLSKSEVQFDKSKPITRAPQDQRHEFKVAGMFNWKQFFLSANYVYGSGFPNIQNLTSSKNIRPYSRLDIGGLYRFKVTEISIDFGCSILNVLNTYNVQYNSLANFPKEGEQYIQAMPLSLTFFAHFRF
jgi:hypothetical protein